MKTARPSVSSVIPCFNEESSIEEAYTRISNACRAACKDDYEIIFVDDGSTDNTWSILKRLALDSANVMAIKLSRNFGHQIALSAGLEACSGNRIFILDADLQDPPELLGDMMKRMDDGVEVVYGRRIKRDDETAFKKITSKIFYRVLNNLSDVPIPLDSGDFRLVSRRALDQLLAMPEQDRFLRGMMAWMGFRQEPFDYVRQGRHAGRSNYSLGKMLALSADALTSFSVKPLRIASLVGLVFGAIAALMLLYVLVSWIFFTTVSGWTSTIALMLTLSSVQLLVLGVLGEYLGRMFMETKRRPLFLVEELVSTRPSLAPQVKNDKSKKAPS